MKICRTCEINKEEIEYTHNNRICKECRRVENRDYRRNNKDKSKKWVEENKDKMKKLQANWYKNNKSKINETFRKNYNSLDGEFKKIKNYRTAISHMISGNQKKNRYIGCNKDELINWLKCSFQENMTLENYGTNWVVDHVLPLNLAKENPDTFEIITKWYNITAVSMDYNLRKNKYIDTEQLTKHLNTIEEYFENHQIKKDIEYMELIARYLVAGSSLEI